MSILIKSHLIALLLYCLCYLPSGHSCSADPSEEELIIYRQWLSSTSMIYIGVEVHGAPRQPTNLTLVDATKCDEVGTGLCAADYKVSWDGERFPRALPWVQCVSTCDTCDKLSRPGKPLACALQYSEVKVLRRRVGCWWEPALETIPTACHCSKTRGSL